MSIHVIPINDLVEHHTNDSCVCGPTNELVDRDDGTSRWMVVHHSLDGREHTEAPHAQ